MRLPLRPARRDGFTVIELLVVISIIAVVASLSIGAVFTLRESQMKNFTEATVQKLASALDQQWKAVLDQANEETPAVWAMNQSVSALTNQPDLRRSRVLHGKGKLRQEFPISFGQVVTASGAPATITFATGLTLPPKQAYLQALNGVTSATEPAWSSSAMLYMVLSQGRRGMAAAPPETLVDASAIQSATANGRTFSFFVDAWGNPLRFFAFPTGNDEINGPPYVTMLASNPNQGWDVQDPEDTLMSPAWTPALRNDFMAKIHALPAAGQNVRAHHLIPVVAAAGKDGAWGIDLITMGSPTGDSTDNIYSYRLRRFGQRGD